MIKILDITAGTKSMWFDTSISPIFCDLEPKSADVVRASWAERLPFDDATFDMVVFDPPHLTKTWAGTGKIAQKYGHLFASWRTDLSHAFAEAHRLMKPGGFLVFKWNTRQFSIYQILAEIPFRPLFGHTTAFTNKSTTLWAIFVKE